MNKKQNPLGLDIGDIVEIHLDFKSEGPFQATITDICDRTEINQDAGINYSRLDGKTNEPLTNDGCSVSFVTKVVSRRIRDRIKPQPPKNIFAESLSKDFWIGYSKMERGIYAGSLNRLACAALSSAKGGGLDRPLSADRLTELWNQSRCPGTIKSSGFGEGGKDHFFDDRLHVKWKVFKNWVIRNRNRILMSQKEIEKMGQEYDEYMCKSIEEDLDFLFPEDDGAYTEDPRLGPGETEETWIV